jgi:hypothetical protein
MFFSEEKNQKTFASGAARRDPGLGRLDGSGGDIKVFCFFSSEKKNL